MPKNGPNNFINTHTHTLTHAHIGVILTSPQTYNNHRILGTQNKNKIHRIRFKSIVKFGFNHVVRKFLRIQTFYIRTSLT